MQYWWVALLLIAICVFEVFLVWLMRDNRKLSLIVLFVIACILMLYKTSEFSFYRATGQPKYPVEFSHISYFIVGATMLSGIKKMRAFAGFCCLLAGAGYIIAGVLSPDSMVTTMSSTYYVVLAIIQHELLWFCGVLLLCNTDKFNIKEIYIPLIGIAIMIVFSILVHQRIIYSDYDSVDNMVIIQIITGSIIGYLIGEESLTTAIRIVTVVGIVAVATGALFMYYVINNKIRKAKEKRKSIEKEYSQDFDIGIIPWVRNYVSKKEAQKLEQSAKGDSENTIEKDDIKKLD